MVGLGQVNIESTIKLTTKLNRKVTGLSDVFIDIYSPDGTKLVNNATMSELGSTGIYQYEYTVPITLGTSTVDITCASQRDYNELQTFTAITPPTGGGGGMVVQYPAKVINKSAIRKEKALNKLLVKIDVKLEALLKKNPKIDISEINKETEKRLKKIESNFKGLLDDGTKKISSNIHEAKDSQNKSTQRLIQGVADFTDKIYQLQENTKLLPNSLNSLLISAERANTSKFKEIEGFIKDNFDKMNEQTSKFSAGLSTSSTTLIERFNQVENKLSGQIGLLPKFISDETIEDMQNELRDNLKELGSEILRKNIENVNLDVDGLIRRFGKIESNISNIPSRRDLNYTQEEINDKIKEMQSNNTKKIKTIRDNIEDISKEVKETKKEQTENNKRIMKKIKNTEEETTINSQLALLNGGTPSDQIGR